MVCMTCEGLSSDSMRNIKQTPRFISPVTLTTISGVDLATPQTQEGKKSLIIADFLGSGKEEKKLLQNYHQLLEKGTKYVKPSNIVMNLMFLITCTPSFTS